MAVTLLLLPGMNGTVDLFDPLISQLHDFDCQAVYYPETGPQDPDSLADYVCSVLPEGEFVIVAESYSGPVAAALMQRELPPLKAVILVATFFTAPKPLALSLLRRIPFQGLIDTPLATLGIRLFCLGWGVSREQLEWFRSNVRDIPQPLLNARIKVMQALREAQLGSDLPVLYLQASGDRLISRRAWRRIKSVLPQATLQRIKGPHFLMQMRAEQGATYIREALTAWGIKPRDTS